MSTGLSTLQRLRLIYKTRQFPWKKHIMVGWDLDGNEYWEMPNPNNPGGRWKRWVQMKESPDDVGLFEENKLPVQWQAWLRHTRFEPPSIQDLVKEQQRLALLRERVRQIQASTEKEQQEKQLPAFRQTPAEGGDEPAPWTPTAPSRRS